MRVSVLAVMGGLCGGVNACLGTCRFWGRAGVKGSLGQCECMPRDVRCNQGGVGGCIRSCERVMVVGGGGA